MPVPQQLLDALNAVQTDDDARLAASADHDAKVIALATATTDEATSNQALTAAVAHEATDVEALTALIHQIYG